MKWNQTEYKFETAKEVVQRIMRQKHRLFKSGIRLRLVNGPSYTSYITLVEFEKLDENTLYAVDVHGSRVITEHSFDGIYAIESRKSHEIFVPPFLLEIYEKLFPGETT